MIRLISTERWDVFARETGGFVVRYAKQSQTYIASHDEFVLKLRRMMECLEKRVNGIRRELDVASKRRLEVGRSAGGQLGGGPAVKRPRRLGHF